MGGPFPKREALLRFFVLADRRRRRNRNRLPVRPRRTWVTMAVRPVSPGRRKRERLERTFGRFRKSTECASIRKHHNKQSASTREPCGKDRSTVLNRGAMGEPGAPERRRDGLVNRNSFCKRGPYRRNQSAFRSDRAVNRNGRSRGAKRTRAERAFKTGGSAQQADRPRKAPEHNESK